MGRALCSERGAPPHRARGLAHGDRLAFGSRWLDVRAAPGHTDGCDFAGYLHHLGLPHLRLMAIAVPAKLRCGRPADGTVLPADRTVLPDDRSRPVVIVCRPGARSAPASVMLRQAGLAQVANLAGGLLRW